MKYEIYKEKNIKISIKAIDNIIEKFSKLFKIDKDTNLSLAFVSSAQIKKMNFLYRKKNKPTDVLSFATKFDSKKIKNISAPEDLLGEVFICYAIAKQQAKEQKKTIQEVINKLLIHGLVHLVGYDHIIDKDWIEMQKVEDKLFKISTK
jgi:probable rRNA maturation factor